jgi:outer membrane lipoprotein-sorting protein
MRILAIGALAAMAVVGGGPAKAEALSTDIRSYVCQRLDDFTATMTVVKADQRELGKISKDIGMLYQFKSVLMRYREPNMVRIEGTVDGTRGVYVMKGDVQTVRVPKLGLKTRRDFGASPGKRKSLMDVGLISDYYLSYARGAFLREGTVDGVPCAVFDMTYANRDEDTSHHVVYIDPRTKVVRKRESYGQDGKLRAIYFYKDVQQVQAGVWFPTRIEVENTDRVIAGITQYRNIKVNTGVPEGVFE